MKNKDIKKNPRSREEVEEIQIIEEDLLSKFTNKLNKDNSEVLKELANIIKGKIKD